MASKVDIWNLALSNLGHKANISDPDESSVEANHCRRFYPIALGAMLELFPWNFATRRVALAEVDNPVEQWSFAYSLPNPCVRALAVLLPGSTDDAQEQSFAIESDEDGNEVLFTDVEDAVLKYTTLVTDTNRFPYIFVQALSCQLASMLVGPISKETAKRNEMLQLASVYVGQAEANNASASKSDSYSTFIPSHLAAR